MSVRQNKKMLKGQRRIPDLVSAAGMKYEIVQFLSSLRTRVYSTTVFIA